MATYKWVYIGLGNDLVPGHYQDKWSLKSIDIHLGAISQEIPDLSITKISLKIR